LAIVPTDTEEILVVIEAYYDGMTRGDADVLDKPSKRHSAFFTLVKIKGTWLMISKTFIAASEAKKYSLP
jgi:hypothetical protein